MTQRLIEAARQAKEALELVDANSVKWCFHELIAELDAAIKEYQNDIWDIQQQDVEKDG